ncbi:cytochrome c biogenesis protein ResB [Alkalicoccus urumqiensis]|uniref:Cytochrome C biogenesis protein n=1 Tax=Alkalicoccus urumqiensis TaxID=1548213 RepID=A0A2P6ML37_ALKUR|nr:cytochrome c biogenesis protein ResB [Alkalicoccus urumqiensis]PRO66973.1 cytochrome C biogenesis protein [Alkalicoccus urumqiensis]
MNKVTCECGHQNPYGTYLCESCGKPLQESDEKVANMRYEGVARRSQTYKSSIVDKIWNFFSSVKVGIWIIVLILVTSSLGTIFPQEMYIPPGTTATEYYQEEYGIAGQLYYDLGFHNLYSSWWYMMLIAALGISLVIASLDRFVPLYRALKKQRTTRHTAFMKKQRVFGESEGSLTEEDRTIMKERLKQKRYRVKEENGNLFAEKNRFSRWGPYVNHIGLIIFLIGGMLRFFPGMYLDEYVWIREGEREVISGTNGEYFVENREFMVELYDDQEEDLFQEALTREDNPVVSNFQTSATLYKRPEGIIGDNAELEKVKDHDIRVNQPLTFEGISLYQVDYRLNELSTFTFTVESDTVDLEEDMTFQVDLNDPARYYEFENGYQIELLEYFPNFYIDNNGEPSTQNRVPDNPRIIFELFTPDQDPEAEGTEGELSLIGVRVNEELNGERDHVIRMEDVELVDATGLTVRRDHTLPFLIAGGAIFMVGLIQGSYWHHRRIWIQEKAGRLYVAGHANKNWHALKRDLSFVSENTRLPEAADQLDDEAENEEEVQQKKGGNA